MNFTFKAGETYQTYDGRSATLIGKVHGWFIGYTWEHGPIPTRWFESGSNENSGLNLQPPKRQVWIAVWDDGCRIQAKPWESESGAEMWARPSPANTSVRRIAVLGPIDVEAEP